MAAKLPLKRLACLALVAAGALLLSGCTSPEVCSDMTSFETFFSGWQPVLFMATFVVFLVAGLAYILAGVVSHKGVRTWAVNQFYEGIGTLVLAVFFVGLVSWMCGLDARIFGAETKCVPIPAPWFIDIPGLHATAMCGGRPCDCGVFHVASFYIQDFKNMIVEGFVSMFLINMVIAALGSITVFAGTSGIGAQISMGAGLSQVSQQFGMGMSMVATALLLISAQAMLLKIAEHLFAYLMIAGLLLRSFGATRGFGGALIAIAIGFFLVYPLAIILMYGLLLDKVSNDYTAMATAGQGVSRSSGDFVQQILSGLGGFVEWLASPITGAINFVGSVVVGAIFVPFIIFMIVISFVKGLSSAIGEEVDVSNLTRLI